MDLERLVREALTHSQQNSPAKRRHIAHFAALVLEEAAKAVELPAIADADLDHDEKGCYHCGLHDGRSEAAEAIRALKPAASPPRP